MKNEVLKQLLEPVVSSLGYIFWGCEYIAQGKHSLLRVYIDSEQGIMLEDCEKVSHQVSHTLDVEDPIKAQYSLEISSPGVDRPLFETWQYKQYVGQSIKLSLHRPMMGKRKLTGKIASIDDVGNMVLTVDDQEIELPLSIISKANLVQ